MPTDSNSNTNTNADRETDPEEDDEYVDTRTEAEREAGAEFIDDAGPDIVQYEQETDAEADDERPSTVDELGQAAQIGDPTGVQDTEETARLDPPGVEIDLPDDLGAATTAEWDSDRRERVRDLVSSDSLPRGYHVRVFVNAVTGDIHDIIAAPAEASVMETPSVVSLRADAGTLVDPTLTPRERAAVYEVRFDPDEFVTGDDMDSYEAAVRARHDDRMDELASATDVMDLPAETHDVYWAESVAEAYGEDADGDSDDS